jgi:hypothetical protein
MLGAHNEAAGRSTASVFHHHHPSSRRNVMSNCLRGRIAGTAKSLLLLAPLGCAARSAQHRPADQSTAHSTASSPSSVIDASELSMQDVGDLLQAVRRVRPEFLRMRNPTTQSPQGSYAEVYLENRLLGGPESLRLIGLGEVREIRLIKTAEAAVLFGRIHPGGAIVVRRR